MTETPNARYPHLWVVARVDDYLADAATEVKMSLVSAYADASAADAEAERLNALNGDKDCRYVVLMTRLKG